MLVEIIFMMVILKLPIVYLCLVVWWAVRAEPRPPQGAANPARLPEPGPDGRCPWFERNGGPRRLGPCHGRRVAPVARRRARVATR